MKALDVMTSSVISVTPETTVRDAAKLLVQHRISAMPVVDGDGQLIGMVSEGDLLHRTEIGTEKSHRSWWLELVGSDRDAGDYVKSHGQTVADIMTRDAICVAELTPLNVIASILESHHIKRMPVCGKGGSLASSAARISCRRWPRARKTPRNLKHPAIKTSGRGSWRNSRGGTGRFRVAISSCAMVSFTCGERCGRPMR